MTHFRPGGEQKYQFHLDIFSLDWVDVWAFFLTIWTTRHKRINCVFTVTLCKKIGSLGMKRNLFWVNFLIELYGKTFGGKIVELKNSHKNFRLGAVLELAGYRKRTIYFVRPNCRNSKTFVWIPPTPLQQTQHKHINWLGVFRFCHSVPNQIVFNRNKLRERSVFITKF